MMDVIKEVLRERLQLLSGICGPLWTHATSAYGLVGLGICLTVYWLVKRSRSHFPPGPSALPLIGNYSLLSDIKMHETLAKMSDAYGPVITVAFGPSKMVILNTIEPVMEALVKRRADFADRPVFVSGSMMSEGGNDIVFAQYTPTWKLHRKIAGSALRNYMKGGNMEAAIEGSMEQLVRLFAANEGRPFVPHAVIDLTTFNILCTVCFQKVYDFDDPKFKHFAKVDNDFTEELGIGLVEDLFPLLAKVWPSKRYTKVKRLVAEILQFVDDEYREHLKNFDEGNIRDFTDSLIMARKQAEYEDDAETLSNLKDVHLRQTMFDIFIGGLDTTRFTIQWALIYLADNPEAQKKCQSEMDKAVGRSRLPRIEDRADLPYTEATLHEVMRIATVAPLGMPHRARVDSTIGGYDIPKGTVVAVNHWALHNDTRHWENPDEFKPERFLDSDGNLTQKPASWLPFSAGRRVCLGESAAKPELMIMIAIILHQFDIRLPPGVKADYSPEFNSFVGYTVNKYQIIADKRA